MSIWAGIKYAINSTIGTSKFKPLDKLIDDSIKATRSLAPSDTVYKVLFQGSTTEYNGKFNMQSDGAIRLIAAGTADGYNSVFAARFELTDENGNEIIDTVIRNHESIDIPLKSGEYNILIYTLYDSPSDTQDIINSVKICAQIIDGSLLTII